MGTVDLTFRYTQEEYVTAERQYLFASRIITKPSVVVLAVYVPSSLLYCFLSSFHVLSLLAVGIAVIALIMGCALYYYMPVRKFKKTAKYQEAYQMIFSNDGIQFETPTIHSELKWAVYSELWENKGFYFLIQAPHMYTLIPKRAFQTPSARLAFEELVQLNLNSTKRMV